MNKNLYTSEYLQRVASNAVDSLFSWIEKKNKEGTVVMTSEALDELIKKAENFSAECLTSGGVTVKDGVITTDDRAYADAYYFFLVWLNSWYGERNFYTDKEFDVLDGYFTLMSGGTIGGPELTEAKENGRKKDARN